MQKKRSMSKKRSIPKKRFTKKVKKQSGGDTRALALAMAELDDKTKKLIEDYELEWKKKQAEEKSEKQAEEQSKKTRKQAEEQSEKMRKQQSEKMIKHSRFLVKYLNI